MSRQTLSPELLRFVHAHLTTIDHLQVVLNLWRERATGRTVDEIVGSSQMDRGRIEAVLQDLTRDEIAVSDNGRYHLDQKNPEVERGGSALEDAYNRLPVQLVRAVYDRPPVPLQSFADAFRLRQGD